MLKVSIGYIQKGFDSFPSGVVIFETGGQGYLSVDLETWDKLVKAVSIIRNYDLEYTIIEDGKPNQP